MNFLFGAKLYGIGGTSGHANNRCRMADERIYQIGKPHKFHDMGYTTVWQIPPSRNTGHVCSYPEELVKRCLLMTTDEGDTVLDPFMGSGTTGVVAVELGRKFIGIELAPEYFNLSKQRIESTKYRKQIPESCQILNIPVTSEYDEIDWEDS